MRTKPLLLLAVPILAVLTPTPTGASPQGPTKAPVHLDLPAKVQVSLQALDRLRSYGYTWTTDAGALRAVKAWQRANGLTVDGIVGPQTLASLDLGATATAPATRLNPPAPQPETVEGIIRDVWPDDLEDRAVAIATRESRLQPEVINRNGDATGLFQVMWSVHRSWLCPQLGVCAQSQLQDARTNATAALALWQRAGSWQPWAL